MVERMVDMKVEQMDVWIVAMSSSVLVDMWADLWADLWTVRLKMD